MLEGFSRDVAAVARSEALGSSAPEILLSINDMVKSNFLGGDLGPSTSALALLEYIPKMTG